MLDLVSWLVCSCRGGECVSVVRKRSDTNFRDNLLCADTKGYMEGLWIYEWRHCLACGQVSLLNSDSSATDLSHMHLAKTRLIYRQSKNPAGTSMFRKCCWIDFTDSLSWYHRGACTRRIQPSPSQTAPITTESWKMRGGWKPSAHCHSVKTALRYTATSIQLLLIMSHAFLTQTPWCLSCYTRGDGALHP